MNKKALLLPYNNKHELFLQDRRGFKAPDWGFFGGSVEAGESSLQAVIREAKEELNLDVAEADLIHLGEFVGEFGDETSDRSAYLYRTNQDKFTVSEGAGGHWLSYAGCLKRLEEGENFNEIWLAIEALPEAA